MIKKSLKRIETGKNFISMCGRWLMKSYLLTKVEVSAHKCLKVVVKNFAFNQEVLVVKNSKDMTE